MPPGAAVGRRAAVRQKNSSEKRLSIIQSITRHPEDHVYLRGVPFARDDFSIQHLWFEFTTGGNGGADLVRAADDII